MIILFFIVLIVFLFVKKYYHKL